MDNIVVAIAESRAEILHRLSKWWRYSRFNGELDAEEQQDVLLAIMTAEAAAARALETNRKFGVVIRVVEMEMEVAIHLARILARPEEDSPRRRQQCWFLGDLKALSAAAEEGLVCGVCQEEMGLMEDAGRVREIIGCGHKFHEDCIVEWLKRNSTRPLCRYQLQD